MQHKNGTWIYILSRAKMATNEDGTFVKPMRMVGTHVDITKQKESQKQLFEAAVVFNSTSEGIFFTDKDGIILRVNKAFTDITGYKESDVIEHKASILSSGKHSKEFYATLWNDILEKGVWSGEIWNKTKSGTIYPQLLTINSIKNEKGEIENFVAIFNDITVLKQKEAELDYLAHHDPLTQLPNRTLLKARLQQALSSAKRHDLKTALLYFDIDNFKNINDSFGHPAGDQLLI
jgi:PAS domain S-box-containing protein